MSAHARLLTPTLPEPASDSGDPAGAGVSYGDLITLTRQRIADAARLSRLPQPDARAALAEMRGYDSFLHAAGVHLDLLSSLSPHQPDSLRRLIRRLRMVTADEPAGHWHDAATTMAAAHDVAASHFGPQNTPLTPEANDLLTGPAALSASHQLAALLIETTEASHALLGRAARAQLGQQHHPISKGDFNRAHRTNEAVEVLAGATLWHLDRLRLDHLATDTGRTLDELRPATTAPTPAPESRGFGSALAALQALRQISYAQAHDQAPASPASLRDLARLGARLTQPEALPLPDSELDSPRGLDRLMRAHAADQLDAAHVAWEHAASDLTTTIQGVTKAPASYSAAIHTLLDTEDLTPEVRRSLTRALPHLGTDAADTVRHLARCGALVSPQPVFCQPRRAWRPITEDQSWDIQRRFEQASKLTANLTDTLRQLRPRPTRQPEHLQHRAVAQRQHLSLGAPQ